LVAVAGGFTMGGTVAADVTALSFPADDAVFQERVREALDEAVRESRGEDVATLLVRRLRVVHPNVATSPRAAIAGFGGTTIYVFRDGSALSSFHEESWIRDGGTARVVMDEGGTYVEANEATAALFGVPVDEIIGRTAGTFTRPDARVEEPAALWRALTTGGKLHSLAVVRCPSGEEESVEFVTIRDEAGPGRNVTYLRRIE
jgi:PAS domain S-box-containing protein